MFPYSQSLYCPGIGNLKGLFERIATDPSTRERINPRTLRSDMGAFIWRGRSDGPCFSDWASLSLSCGVCGWALGKKDLSAPGTEPESGGGIKLSGRKRRCGPIDMHMGESCEQLDQ